MLRQIRYSLHLVLILFVVQPLTGCHGKMTESTTTSETMGDEGDGAAIMDLAIPVESKMEASANAYAEEEPSRGMGAEKAVAQADTAHARMLDRDGTLSIQVRNYQHALDSVRMLVKRWGGYLESVNETNADYMQTRTAELHLRVPSKGFDGAMNQLAGLGLYVNERSETVTDVTRAYQNNLVKLKARRILQERYLTLLKQARNVKEIMQIEQELNNIRYEIELAESQKRATEFEVNLSQIRLTLRYDKTRPEVVEPPSNAFMARLGRSLADSVDYLGDMVLAIIRALPSLLLVAGILALPVWWWRRRSRKS